MAEPKVRFKKENGESYPAWERKQIRDIFERVNERNNGQFDNTRWISVAKMYFQEPDKVTSNNIDTRTYVMRYGDMAFEGHPNSEYQFGRFVFNDIGDGVISELFPIYRHKCDYVLGYWKYAIKVEKIMAPIYRAAITSSGASSNKLSENDFLREYLNVPSLDEQKRLADFFEKVDELISISEKEIVKLQELKRGSLHKMFPREGESVPEVRFPGFTDAWEQRKFSDVVDIGSGMDYKHLGEGDIPVYGTGGYMLSVDAALSEDKDAIGIGRKGTIDKPYILRAPFWTVDTLFYCIPKDGYDLDFTSCLFQNVDWKKKDESTGVPSLSKVIINNVETTAPSYEEQRKIGDYFKGIDNLITLHQRECEKYKELKKGLLQKMFI